MANGKPPPQLSLSQTSPSPPLPTPAGPTPARPSLIDSFGSSFAKDRRYWSFLGFATLAGLILGLVSSATTNVIAYSLEGWRGDVFGEKSSSSNLTYFAGQLWWIAVVFGGGLTNGLIQAVSES